MDHRSTVNLNDTLFKKGLTLFSISTIKLIAEHCTIDAGAVRVAIIKSCWNRFARVADFTIKGHGAFFDIEF
jgi:hypothetical protein